MEVLIAALLPQIGTLAITAIAGLVSWAGVEVTRFVRTKTRNENINTAMAQITDTVNTVVADLGQTVGKRLREASSDGRLTDEEGKELKRIALGCIKHQIPGFVKKNAALAVNSLDSFIESKIEQAVNLGVGRKFPGLGEGALEPVIGQPVLFGESE